MQESLKYPGSAGQQRFYLITEEAKHLPFITFEGGSITIGEYIPYITDKYPPYNLSLQKYIDGTKQRVEDIFRIKLLAYHAMKKGLHNSPVIQKKLKRFEEDLLAATFKTEKILSEANERSSNPIERNELIGQLEEEWIQRLQEKYKVTIYKKVLKRAYRKA